MLIEIGFKPNNLFNSNSYKYFATPSTPFAQLPVSTIRLHQNSHKQDLKYFQAFFSSRKKKLIKRSMTMPYSEGSRTIDGKTSVAKRLESIENNLERLEKLQALNPFKSVRIRKDAKRKGKASRMEGNIDTFMSSSNRLAVEFPMILNIGSIYSSHVIVYLDP